MINLLGQFTKWFFEALLPPYEPNARPMAQAVEATVVAPQGTASHEDEEMTLEEVKKHSRRKKYTEEDLLDRAIRFRALAGHWPTKDGRAGKGAWALKWMEYVKQVTLPPPDAYLDRFGGLKKAWERAEAKLQEDTTKEENIESR